MFKSKDRKRIEVLEICVVGLIEDFEKKKKETEDDFNYFDNNCSGIADELYKSNDFHNSELAKVKERYNKELKTLSEKIDKLQMQVGCGCEHKTHSSIRLKMTQETAYYYEACSTCKKVLDKFDNKLDADKRTAEILQEKTDEAKLKINKDGNSMILNCVEHISTKGASN